MKIDKFVAPWGECIRAEVPENLRNDLGTYHPRPCVYEARTRIDPDESDKIRLILNSEWDGDIIEVIQGLKFKLVGNTLVAKPNITLGQNNRWKLYKWEMSIGEKIVGCNGETGKEIIDTLHWAKIDEKMVEEAEKINQQITDEMDNQMKADTFKRGQDISIQDTLLADLTRKIKAARVTETTRWTWIKKKNNKKKKKNNKKKGDNGKKPQH